MLNRSHKPLIGVTLDRETDPTYSKFPWYAIRENYMQAVAAAGGIPLGLPNNLELVHHCSELIDGLLITGGAFDIDPKLFGDDALSPFTTTKKERTDFELSITRQCLNRKLPVFGICGGEQLLAVALGGQLIQHIPACPFDTLQHEQKNPRNEAGHEIQIMAGTLLHKIVGVTEMSVNSAHHQAVAHPGPTAKNNARAPDGIIEGIESPLYPFCLGVQWHPEFHISEGDRKLFKAFVSACTPRR